MKRVLFTGKTGFVGRNILDLLRERYDIDAPSRRELDLRDRTAICRYVDKGRYDVVLHMANPNPTKNPAQDQASDMLKDSLSVFLNLKRTSGLYDKLIYAGSGAEFDKRLDICAVTEEEFGRSVPEDVYGFGKYVMNEIALNSNNIYNLRMFAIHGPYDHESKFITHAINCCMKNEPVTIRQDCWFDYLHVYDLITYMTFLIENQLQHHDYNCCSGERYSLSEIAREVCRQMGSGHEIKLLAPGWNKEYTGSCQRFKNEYGQDPGFISLQEGVEMQIKFMKG